MTHWCGLRGVFYTCVRNYR